MRPVLPWLSSLILHGLFFIGVVMLTRSPPELPLRLTLDFQLIAPDFRQDVEPEPVAKRPPLAPIEKEPPPPVPKIREAKPEAIIESIVPKVEPDLPEPAPDLAPASPAVPVPFEQRVEIADSDREVEQRQRYARTVNHIRGQVLRKLSYPTIARRQGWKGRLVLSFVLCADGSVENLQVLESSGHKILDRAALKAVAANTPFAGGYPRTEVRLPINFQLN